MSEFSDLEGPRKNEREIFIVESSSRRILSTTSRVEARSMNKNGYTSHGSTEVADGDAHIGDTVWCILSSTNEPKSAYFNETSAHDEKEDDENIVRIEIRHWDVTQHNLYGQERLQELRDKGIK